MQFDQNASFCINSLIVIPLHVKIIIAMICKLKVQTAQFIFYVCSMPFPIKYVAKQTFGYTIEIGWWYSLHFKFVLGGNTGTNSYYDIYTSSLTCKNKRHDPIYLFIMYYLK